MQLEPQCLPDPRTLGKRAMSLAMLDAIICPEFQYRYFSFDGAWGDEEQMGAMRNGDGDHWFLHLADAGAVIKGFVQELPRSDARAMALQVQRRVPADFNAFLHEPSFETESVSFCYWRRSGDHAWSKVEHPEAHMEHRYDGSEDYLSILLAPADCYYDYATEYFECEIPLVSIEHIYAHAPLTASIVKSLNPQLSLEDARAAARLIGYPSMPRAVAATSMSCSGAA